MAFLGWYMKLSDLVKQAADDEGMSPQKLLDLLIEEISEDKAMPADEKFKLLLKAEQAIAKIKSE